MQGPGAASQNLELHGISRTNGRRAWKHTGWSLQPFREPRAETACQSAVFLIKFVVKTDGNASTLLCQNGSRGVPQFKLCIDFPLFSNSTKGLVVCVMF